MEVSGQLYAPIPLSPKEESQNPLNRRLDGLQDWSGYTDEENDVGDIWDSHCNEC
jgi:hypothetical protein